MLEQKNIIEKIPSITLRKAIIENGIKLPENLLFKIGYRYSITMDERLSLIENFLENSDDESLKKMALSLYNNLNDNFEEFIKDDKDVIYEAIVEKCNDDEESYIAYSYEEILQKLGAILAMCAERGWDLDCYNDIHYFVRKRLCRPYEDVTWINDTFACVRYNQDLDPCVQLFRDTGISPVDEETEETIISKWKWMNYRFPDFFKAGDLVSIDDERVALDNTGIVLHDPEYYYSNEDKEPVGQVILLNDLYRIILEGKEALDDLSYYINYVPFTELTVLNENLVDDRIHDNYLMLKRHLGL